MKQVTMASESNIKDLQGNLSRVVSRPKSLESDQEEFRRFHPEKVWKNDKAAKCCANCRVGFGMTRRKHHCRECGDVFCYDCSSKKIVVHGTLKRCCLNCYKQAVSDPNNFGGSTNGADDDDGMMGKGYSKNNSFAKASFMANSMSSSPSRGSYKKNKDSAYEGNAAKIDGTKPSSSSTTTKPEADDLNAFQYPPWVEVVVYTREETVRNGSDASTQRAFACHPAGVAPQHMLQDICNTAVPYLHAQGAATLEDADSAANFMFRVRDRSNGGLSAVSDAPVVDSDQLPEKEEDDSGRSDVTSGTLFYNCYASYRESYHDEPNGYSSSRTTVRHAVVIVSRWPFPLLAFYALFKLDEALNWSNLCIDDDKKGASPMSLSSAGLGSTGASNKTYTSSKTSVPSVNVITENQLSRDFHKLIENVIAVGYTQLLTFPEPKIGQTMSCPFLGETLHYNPPADLKPAYGQNMSLAASANAVNLVSKLTPLGLLNHIWALWELVATGKDILVVSESATHSSELVLALASLLCPLGYNGDCRPFMQPRDSDVFMLRRMSLKKQQERRDLENKASKDGASIVSNTTARNFRNSSIIVGATDPKMLKILKNFDACIFLGPVYPGDVPQTAQAMREQVRKRHSAAFRMVNDDVSFEVVYNAWKDDLDRHAASQVSASNSNPVVSEQKTIVLYKSVLQTSDDRDVVHTIKNMDSLTSMRVLGDKLMRDRLSAMTVAFFKPIDAGITLEVAEMRAAALERARIAEEQRQVTQLKEAIQRDCDSGLLDLRYTVELVKELPATLPYMVPTLVMWCMYVIGLFLYLVLNQPLPPLLCLILIGVFPVEAPKKFERLLRVVMPLWVLYPLIFDHQGRRKDGRDGRRRNSHGGWERIPSNTPEQDEIIGKKKRKSVTINENGNNHIDEDGASSEEDEAPNNDASGSDMPASPGSFSGVWKRYKTVDYDKFVMAQGAGWMKGRLAASIALEHIITMDDGGRFFRLMERGGPVKKDHTYTVDGVTVDDTVITEAKFKDKASWDGGALFIHKLIQPDEKYELLVHRYLDDDTHLRIVAQYINFASPEKNVTATSFFEKTGPSPSTYVQEMAEKVAANPVVSASASASDGVSPGVAAADTSDSNTVGGAIVAVAALPTSSDASSPTSTTAAPAAPVAPSVPAVVVKYAANVVDFSGCWLRNRTANYDAILFALGMTQNQRRSALANRMMLTIKMSDDKQALTITETMTAERKGGDSVDSADAGGNVADRTQEVTYTINVMSDNNQCSPGETEIMGHRWSESATFQPSRSGGGVLRIRQVRDDKACESIIELNLMPALKQGLDPELCMCNTFRDLKKSGKDPVEAVQVFSRMPERAIKEWEARCKPDCGENIVKRESVEVDEVAEPRLAFSEEMRDSLSTRKSLHGSWQRDADSKKVVHKLALSRDLTSITISEKVGDGATSSHLYKVDDPDDAVAPRSTFNGITYIEKVEWDVDSLVVRKKAIDGETMIVVRRMIVQQGNGPWMKELLQMDTSLVHVPSGKETKSSVTFSRI